MTYTRKFKKVETRKERWQREQIMRAMEDVLGVPRESWETSMSKRPSIVYIRRLYIYLTHTLLGYSHWDIVDLMGVSQSYVNKSIQALRKQLKAGEHEAELKAILENYEKRPEYSFDTIA